LQVVLLTNDKSIRTNKSTIWFYYQFLGLTTNMTRSSSSASESDPGVVAANAGVRQSHLTCYVPTRNDLLRAVALSALGGVIGIVLATAALIGLSQLMELPYIFDVQINLLSFLFSAAIGVVFGFFPARRATQINPIEALRHE